MTLIFLLAFHLKFTINANIVYIPVKFRNSPRPSCAPITMVSYFNSLSLRLLCPDPSSLTERTSKNQLLETSNDTTYVAKLVIFCLPWLE